jgi:HEAT repeat protein
MPTEHNNILIELNKAVKALNFYPERHPSLDAQLAHCHSLLKSASSAEGAIKWTVDQKGFYSEKISIAAEHIGTAALAKQFFLRRIKVMTFRPDITLNDVTGFLSLLSHEPADILLEGGVEKMLAKRGVRGVLVNEMSYEELKNLEEEVKEEEEIEEAMLVEESEEEEAGEDEQKITDERRPPSDELPIGEETLDHLLERFKRERDTIKYKDLAVRIKEKAEAAISQGHFDDSLPVLLVFSEHTRPASGLTEDLRDITLGHLRKLLTPDTINHLIILLGQGEEEDTRQAIEQILLKAGEEVTGLLLDALVDTNEASARRNIYNTLVSFGEIIRHEVERRLGDERWFGVRQMVSLLGALGGTQSLALLEAAYAHPDIRVRREVLKSLSRIPSKRSSEILMGALKNGDRALRGQAVISLAILKDPNAVDILGQIAVKREAFSDNLELRKEAVKALGIIGDEKAVQYLTTLILKKVWFGKKDHEEIRLLAVMSLGRIGGHDAMDAIERASHVSKGALYSACKRFLEGDK